jgi:transglutaminase-like putative cysteine protease
MKKSLTQIVLFLVTPLFFLGLVSASDVTVRVTRNYYIDDADKVKVVETHIIENNHATKAVSDSNSERFSINVTAGNTAALKQTLATVTMQVDGKKATYTTEEHPEYALIDVKMPTHIAPGKKMTFQIEYTNFGLIEKKGALIDFYASGYKKDPNAQSATQANTLATEYVFDTYVSIAKTLPAINLVTPDNHDLADTKTYSKYYFSHESLLDKYIWIQIGKKQYYKFTIKQKVTATETSNNGYENEYRLIVPRDIDEPMIYQKVYFTNINPQPSYADQDVEGNLILGFKRPSSETSLITVEGYAEVGRNDGLVNATTSGNKADLNLNNQDSYLNPDVRNSDKLDSLYWQVNDNQIKSVVSQQVGGEKNVYTISKKLYDFVINKIDYSKVKRFGINERQGAIKTLNTGAGVCMEYADLYLTLTRAAGIPTRAVFGYGYDSKMQDDQQEAHQWVQVFMPALNKWVSIDVTWGESGMQMAEGTLNHFFTHVTSINPNSPAIVERKTFGTGGSLETPQYSIEAVDKISNPAAGARTQGGLLIEYPKPAETGNSANGILGSMAFLKNINISTLMIVVGILLMFASVIGIIRMGREEAN